MDTPIYEIVDLHDGEFVFPANARPSGLSSRQVLDLLAGPALKGIFAFKCFTGLCVAGLLIALLSGPSIPGIIMSSILGCICAFALKEVAKKPQLARRVAADPSFVQWAHPSIGRFKESALNTRIYYATLHLQDGSILQVAMSQDLIQALFAWLLDRHPGLRLSGSATPVLPT